jgi:DNA-binding response OmpR family regulator
MSLIFAAQVRELECARVAIRLRWAEMLYFFENFVLDPARRELRRGNALITVQPQVFDLLEYLITNRDRVVSKDNILEAVWGGPLCRNLRLPPASMRRGPQLVMMATSNS